MFVTPCLYSFCSIRDQRQRGGNVKRLADAHQRPRREQFLEGRDVPGPPSDRRPDEQADAIISRRLKRSAM